MIPGSKYTSDVGWGCMIRSGQMLLAQALLMNTVGRGFRLNQGSDQQYDAVGSRISAPRSPSGRGLCPSHQAVKHRAGMLACNACTCLNVA